MLVYLQRIRLEDAHLYCIGNLALSRWSHLKLVTRDIFVQHFRL